MEAFCDALVFNWLIAGSDAHAKTSSVLLLVPGVRLAPLSDIASALASPAWAPKIKLAMKIGSHCQLSRIGRPARQITAEALRLDPDAVRTRLLELAGDVAGAFTDAALDIASMVPKKQTSALVKAEAARAQQCANMPVN